MSRSAVRLTQLSRCAAIGEFIAEPEGRIEVVS